jgi:hypothetical protein
MTKVEVARRQLGTALHLFLRDHDPVSVQCLACGGCEVVEALARQSGRHSFTNQILEQRQDLDLRSFRKMRAVYWNAFKHATGQNLDSIRSDERLIEGFSDANNDVALMVGWSDYAVLTGVLPIAAQVFQVWYFALNPHILAPDVDRKPYDYYFANLPLNSRQEQKRRLKRMVEKYEHDTTLLSQTGTENAPLMYRAGF